VELNIDTQVLAAYVRVMTKDDSRTSAEKTFVRSESVEDGTAVPNPFLPYVLCFADVPTPRQNGEATFAKLDEARAKLLKDLNSSDKDVHIMLAAFEVRCTFSGIPKGEVIETYNSLSKLLDDDENAFLPEIKRRSIGYDLVKHLHDPTTIDQGHFGTCAYSGIERMLLFHNPAEATKIIADACIDGKFRVATSNINLEKDDLSSSGFKAGRSDASHILQTALQSASLQTCLDVRIYEPAQSKLRYRQTQDSGGFHEVVFRKDADREVYFDAPSNQAFLNASRRSSSITSLYCQIVGDKDRPAMIQGNPQPKPYPELKQLIYCETEDQLHSVLERLKSNKQLPIMAGIHTSQEPFWTDSGEGAAPGAGGEKGGRHMVVIMDYDVARKLVAVDNSWGRKVDRLGLKDTASKVSLRQMTKALNLTR
jgi:hypothetical protein